MRPSWMDSISRPLRSMLTAIALTGLLGISCAFNAIAESAVTPESDVAPLDEIVVTASKRVSTVQDTPISISAVTGSDLLARGVDSLWRLWRKERPGVSC